MKTNEILLKLQEINSEVVDLTERANTVAENMTEKTEFSEIIGLVEEFNKFPRKQRRLEAEANKSFGFVLKMAWGGETADRFTAENEALAENHKKLAEAMNSMMKAINEKRGGLNISESLKLSYEAKVAPKMNEIMDDMLKIA
jgi:uncharacterized protein YukE